MISASGAEAHRFGRVRRNGYDPAEVDAVVARLIDTLHGHEAKIETLEARLAEADASADAIRRTFIAAETTRDEIIAEARARAGEIEEDAEREAEERLAEARRSAAGVIASAEAESAAMAELADRLDQEIAKRRSEVLGAAQEEAEAAVAEAEWSSAQLKITAAEEADRILADAQAGADRVAVSHVMSRGYIDLANARLLAAASTRASAITADATEEAEEIIDRAHRESEDLRMRAEALSAAVAQLQRSAGELASLASTQVASIDSGLADAIESPEMSKASAAALDEPRRIETMDAGSGSAAVDDHAGLREEELPGTALGTVEPEQGSEIDEVGDSFQPQDQPSAEQEGDELPQTDGTSPDIAAIVDVTDDVAPTISLASADDEDEDEAAPEPRTYYQRSTGIPLSERIKIARKSG
ncbi:MAG: DivIVA domain-containing protein [Acidimicrobiia bacterium]|nr:DivIVA domain-containing protein [Acidimicrobiia bacterium]